MINFRQIEVFRAVMIARSVSGAADILNVTQPGLSRTLKQMESKLDIELFVRKKGRLFPTPEAEELFAEVQSIYKNIEDLEWTIKRLNRGEKLVLRIGASPSVGRQIVPTVLKQVKKDMPSVKIKFDILSVDQITDYIVLNKGDCVVTIFDVEHPIVESEPLKHGGLVCVVPTSSKLATKDLIHARDLIGTKLISFTSSSPHGKIIKNFFEQANEEFVVDIYVRFAETACAMVEQGLGVALVDEFTAAGGGFKDLVIIPVSNNHKFTVNLLSHSTRALSAAGRCFREKINDVLRSK